MKKTYANPCSTCGIVQKQIMGFLLVLSVILFLLPVGGARARESRGVSLSTDAAVFSKLNLTLTELREVKDAVNAGNVTLAKTKLLEYYTAKFASYDPDFTGDSFSPSAAKLALHETAPNYGEHYINDVTISGRSYALYEIDLNNNLSGIYSLAMVDKVAEHILVASREYGGKAPQLILTLQDGTTKTLTAKEDTQVRAGASYESINYGTATELRVMDDFSQQSDGAYLPYGPDTSRVYLKFDTSQIPSNVKSAKLKIYARVNGGTAVSRQLFVFKAYFTTWTEGNLTWKHLFDNNGVGHYSYKGMPGGFDWQQVDGVDSEWYYANTSFLDLV